MIDAPDSEASVRGVLVVESDRDLAREMADGLAAEGFAVSLAATAAEAAQLLDARRGRIAVVVADLRMPGPAGADLLRRLRDGAFAPDPPELVLMSGHTSEAEVALARRSGAIAVLRKPVVWNDLALAVETGVAAWSTRRADPGGCPGRPPAG